MAGGKLFLNNEAPSILISNLQAATIILPTSESTECVLTLPSVDNEVYEITISPADEEMESIVVLPRFDDEVYEITISPADEEMEPISVNAAEQHIDDHIENVEPMHTTTPTKRRFAEPRYISEITPADVTTPRKAHTVLSLVRRINLVKNNKIKKLEDKNRFLLKRICDMKDLIKNLNRKALISKVAGNKWVNLR